jgi:hypothetical protein
MGLLPMVEEYGTFAGMDREYVIAKLREHEPELKAAGIVHLRCTVRSPAARPPRHPMRI